jgi:hypothetical protein
MPQVFGPWANAVARGSVVGLLVGLAGVTGTGMLAVRSPWQTGQGVPVDQPIPFSHKHHVNDDGIDCRYCHTTVETSSFAGMPSTETCMNCHSQIWDQSPTLQPVRESFAMNQPIQWNRVYRLPDYVYFDHSIHVQKGVGCSTCHGQVDQMSRMTQAVPLQMSWCLDCHRTPENFVRPRDQVFDMAWRPPPDQAQVGSQLVQQYHIDSKTSCTTCHR